MNRILPLLGGVLLLAFSSTAYCFDSGRTPLMLLANDKETRSILISDSDLSRADTALGGIANAKPRLELMAQELADSLFAKEDAPICEPITLKFLQTSAQAHGFASDSESLKSILVAMRSLDLIDDLILMPLLRTLPIYFAIDTSTTAALRSCPTEEYYQVFLRTQGALGKKFKHAKLYPALMSEEDHKLSDEQKQWFTVLYQYRFEDTPITLAKSVTGIKRLKNNASDEKRVASEFSSKTRKKTHGLTYRISLYSKFNASQIQYLSDIQKRMSRRKKASTGLKIVWDYDDEEGIESEVFHVEAEDKKYDFAVAKLYSEMQIAQKRTDIFGGAIFDFNDLMTAALETGVARASEVNWILKEPEVWNPKKKPFEKILTLVQKYGGPALIFAPPPFNILASSAITLLQTQLFNKKKTNPDTLRVSPF